LNNKYDLFEEMKRGATIVTPNNRLSQHLLREFLKTQGTTVIDKPRCLPYGAFLQDYFKQIQFSHAEQIHPVLLNVTQEQRLWQQIIREQNQYPCTDSLVQEVHSAWTRCQLWSIEINTPDFLSTQQTQQFQRWHQDFQNRLKTLNAITESELAGYLMRFPVHHPSPTLIWVSFDDFTPTQRLLQSTLRAQGIVQSFYDAPAREPIAQCCAAQDPQDELDQLTDWLKARLTDPCQRIAVIVPNLHQQSEIISRHMQQHLPLDAFELSLGKPLNSNPLIAHALQWLAMDTQWLSIHQIRLLLHSPFLEGALSEAAVRTALLEDSRLFQEDFWPLQKVVHTLRGRATHLATLLEHVNEYPLNASPEEWVAAFKTRLTILGFPGEYGLNSSAYQHFQRLHILFDDFLNLSLIEPCMSKQQALDNFHALAQSTVFQTRKTPSIIQISGLLEAQGCEFDAVWVMGLTDQCLPQKVKFSPFIPIHLQCSRQMPHATSEREVQLALQMLARIQNNSQTCVFSYPKLTGDTPNLPSPLIRALPAYTRRSLSHDKESPVITLLEYQDRYEYPIQDQHTLSGGTTVLAYQAQCPFRAFAAYRLHARVNHPPSSGLSDAERGQVMHRMLEIIWKTLANQAALLKLSETDLSQLIDTAIDASLEPLIQQRPYSFPSLIQSVERQRLKSLTHGVLDFEKQRPPFVVKAIEQAYQITLANMEFSVRVDRLDSVSADETWVIDYKSRIPTSKPWNENRPEAPQLLLYTLLDDSINATMFLQVKTGQIAFNGISEEKLAVQGLTPLKKEETWAEKREIWRQKLVHLAEEFVDGHCTPTPQRDATCLTCEFKALCRWG
jgi:ATP-dependent helicase/nuclease subunit B